MATRTLPREEWNEYFDAFSHEKHRTDRADYATLRLAPRLGGRPLETQRLPLQDLTYDPKDDLLEVVVPGLGHIIYRPAAIRVDEAQGRLCRLEVVRQDGACEVIELH
jgi:hypothetical protein